MSLPTSTDGNTPILFQYDPNGPAACIFIAGFGLATIGHTVEMFRLSTWYLMPLVIGCIMETFGYYGRFWLSQSPENFKAYILQLLLILPAPIFIAATIYMSVRRIIEALEADDIAPLRPKIFSKLFVIGDIFCFLVQMAGTGMQATISPDIQHSGGIVVVVGLVLQILVFALFLILTSRFYVNCERSSEVNTPCWGRYVVSLLVSSVLIVLRNIVTGVEHSEGSDGYVNQHEAFAYVFEALPILTVVCIFLVAHPGRLQRAAKPSTTENDKIQLT